MMHTKQTIKIILAIFSLLFSFTVHSVQLKDFDGKSRTLEEFTGKGQWVVVVLWHSDCRISNAVVHEYVGFDIKHSDKNAAVVGVSMDGYENKADATGFIEKHDIGFPNLIGDYDEIAGMVKNLSGAPWGGTPTFMIYSPKGELLVIQSGGVPAKTIEDYIATQGD